MVFVGRAHLEASAERWSRLLGLLEELWRWICMKDEDLAKQMPIGGDVPTLLQQQNHCTVSMTASGNVPATCCKIYHALSLIVFIKSPTRGRFWIRHSFDALEKRGVWIHAVYNSAACIEQHVIYCESISSNGLSLIDSSLTLQFLFHYCRGWKNWSLPLIHRALSLPRAEAEINIKISVDVLGLNLSQRQQGDWELSLHASCW